MHSYGFMLDIELLPSSQILTDAALLKRQKKEIEELRAKLQVDTVVMQFVQILHIMLLLKV